MSIGSHSQTHAHTVTQASSGFSPQPSAELTCLYEVLRWKSQIWTNDGTVKMMTSTVLCLKGRGRCPTTLLLNSKHTAEIQWLRREKTYECQCFLFFPSAESTNFLHWYRGDMIMQNVLQIFFFFFLKNADTMKQCHHTVFNISITCATQKKTRSAKYRTLYLYNTFFFFNNIRDNRPFCCRRWWFPGNCVRTILNQKVKTLKFYTKVHLRVNECKTFTWQNGFQFFFFVSFIFPMMPPWRLPAWAESNGTLRSNRVVLWALARRAGDRL